MTAPTRPAALHSTHAMLRLPTDAAALSSCRARLGMRPTVRGLGDSIAFRHRADPPRQESRRSGEPQRREPVCQRVRGDNVTLIPCPARLSGHSAPRTTPVSRQSRRLTDAEYARRRVTVVAQRTPVTAETK
jgi:hypothetical protein